MPSIDMELLKNNWIDFINLVKQDFKSLNDELRKLKLDLRQKERIQKIINLSKDDISILVLHKDAIISFDPSLEKKLNLLEAFYKRQNLDNDIAVYNYNQIISTDSFLRLYDEINELIIKITALQEKIDELNDLIYEEKYSKDLIYTLGIKYNFDDIKQKLLLLYPVVKTLKVPVQSTQVSQQEQNLAPVSNEDAVNLAVEPIETQEVAEEISSNTVEIETTKSEKEKLAINFQRQKNRFEKLKDHSNDLINKYYNILNDLPTVSMQYYKMLSTYNKAKLEKLGKYEISKYDALSKATAIQLFELKSQIEEILPTLDYLKESDIELFETFVDEFQGVCDRLRYYDTKLGISIKNDESLTNDESKVFFLVNKYGNACIPEEVLTDGAKRSFINILTKAEDGYVSNKRGCNIMTLDVHNKEYIGNISRTVFAIRNNKVLVSYIKLNSNTEASNDGGIFILTSTPLSSEGTDAIQVETDKIIRENMDEISKQIRLIESKDPQFLSLQSNVRNSIIPNKSKV